MASRIDDRAGFVRDLRAHPDSASLATLCRRVLDRIAEARTTTLTREFVSAQADELKVSHDVVVDGVRVRAVLERGPESPEEWSIVVAFALIRIAAELESGEKAKARKFVREADVLESLGIDVYSFVESTTSEDARAAIIDAMVSATRDDAPKGRVGRARAYARVEALRSFESNSAAVARATIASMLVDSPLANVLGATTGASVVRFEARTVPGPRSGFLGALSLVSGFSLLRWVGRGLLSLAGIRNLAAVSVDSSSLTIESKTTFGDRVLRRRTLRVSRDALLAASHATRFPAMRLLVGAVALAFGLVVGGLVIGDGVRSGETYLLLLGAALVLGGGLLDLALAVAWPASKGRAVLDLVIAPKTVLSLVDVPEPDAAATLEWIRGRR